MAFPMVVEQWLCRARAGRTCRSRAGADGEYARRARGSWYRPHVHGADRGGRVTGQRTRHGKRPPPPTHTDLIRSREPEISRKAEHRPTRDADRAPLALLWTRSRLTSVLARRSPRCVFDYVRAIALCVHRWMALSAVSTTAWRGPTGSGGHRPAGRACSAGSPGCPARLPFGAAQRSGRPRERAPRPNDFRASSRAARPPPQHVPLPPQRPMPRPRRDRRRRQRRRRQRRRRSQRRHRRNSWQRPRSTTRPSPPAKASPAVAGSSTGEATTARAAASRSAGGKATEGRGRWHPGP